MDEPTPDDLASHRLVSSRMVEGTPVFDAAGQKLGKVHSVMIDKVTGQVAYALLSFSGLLYIGQYVHPLPWQKLTYDPTRHGYVVDVSPEQLENAPTMALDRADRPHTMTEDEQVYAYYGLMWPAY